MEFYRTLELAQIGVALTGIAILYLGKFHPHRWKTIESAHIENGMQYYRQQRTNDIGQVYQRTLAVPQASNKFSKLLRTTIFTNIVNGPKLTSTGR